MTMQTCFLKRAILGIVAAMSVTGACTIGLLPTPTTRARQSCFSRDDYLVA